MVGFIQNLLKKISYGDGIVLLLLRIFLAPVMILSGYGKLQLGLDDVTFFESLKAAQGTVGYFEWLGIPAPEFMAFMAGWTELLGGWLLLFGLLTRLVSIPLMVTMIVAATTAHWENGWHALHEETLTVPWEWRTDLIQEGVERKAVAKRILRENSNYGYITAAGPITILKNGIEFAATYFLMLLVLFFYGGGRYFSLDYWIFRKFSSPDSD